MSKICKCGAVMDDDMLFCTECGSPLDSKLDDSATKKVRKRTCPRCGAEADSVDVFCISCGNRLDTVIPAESVPEKKKCPKCGEAIEVDDVYCQSCGHPIKESAERRKRVIVGPIIESKREFEPLDEHFYKPGNLD